MDQRWQIDLLGGLRAARPHQVVNRFRTRQTGALLAYMAYHPDRSYPRDVLIELLWPESEPKSGRNRLSCALASLRRQLEPPDLPRGAVIAVDSRSVRLRSTACVTDVAQFEAALQSASRAGSRMEKEARLVEAVECYRGELLPGYFEEWILPERQRLAEQYLEAHRQLVAHREQAGDRAGDLEWARRAARIEPLHEELQYELIRLLAAAGQTDLALRQFREFEKLLGERLGAAPGEESRALVATIEQAGDRRERGEIAPLRAAARPAIDPPAAVAVLKSAAGHTPLPVPAPPSGTVTFLLAEADPPARRAGSAGEECAAPETCLDRLRAVFRQYHGHELLLERDALVMAFSRASDALAAAVAGMECVSHMAYSVTERLPDTENAVRTLFRMALHTGEVPPNEEGRAGAESAAHSDSGCKADRGLLSPACRRAARLLQAAHAGQVLLSEPTAALLRSEPDLLVSLVDLGVYRLSGAGLPERLFQARYPEMTPRNFPPLKALPALAGNLPPPLTRFFGREAEIALLCELLLGEAVTNPCQAAGDAAASGFRTPIQNPKSKIQNPKSPGVPDRPRRQRQDPPGPGGGPAAVRAAAPCRLLRAAGGSLGRSAHSGADHRCAASPPRAGGGTAGPGGGPPLRPARAAAAR